MFVGPPEIQDRRDPLGHQFDDLWQDLVLLSEHHMPSPVCRAEKALGKYSLSSSQRKVLLIMQYAACG